MNESRWLAVLVVLVSAAFVASPVLPYLIAPFRWVYGNIAQVERWPVPQRFAFLFVSAGLAEEFVKAISVLAFAALGAVMPGRLGRILGIRTPWGNPNRCRIRNRFRADRDIDPGRAVCHRAIPGFWDGHG